MKYLTLLLLISCSEIIKPESNEIDVYYVGGQSNASVSLAEGIREGLLTHYKSDTLFSVVQINHGGNAINKWYSDKPDKYFYEDVKYIFSNMPINSKLKGIFWWQGLSDTCCPDSYAEKFNGFIGELEYIFESDLNIIIALTGVNPDIATEESQAQVKAFNDMQIELAESSGHKYFDTNPFPRTDNYHLNDDNYRIIGFSMAINLMR